MEVSICDLHLGAIFSLGLSTDVSLPVCHVTSFTGQNELEENFDSGMNGNQMLTPFSVLIWPSGLLLRCIPTIPQTRRSNLLLLFLGHMTFNYSL